MINVFCFIAAVYMALEVILTIATINAKSFGSTPLSAVITLFTHGSIAALLLYAGLNL